jgi:RNA polymerase sigma-70 factor (ECF subfamily)
VSAESHDLDSLFVAHYASLARLLYRVVGDTHSAEELASEAFWKLHIKPPKSTENIGGWLYTTGLRLALDSLKKRRRRIHYEARAERPDTPPNPLETAESRQRRERLRTALIALKPDQAFALALRSEGHSLNEIAEMLALAPGSVGTFLARAQAALRKEYLKLYGER